jgi:hypothetical protein
MMDLLVQAASLNKLNPSAYSLVVLDSNQHIIHFKPNQTVGQIVRSCQLPQINGSSTISLLPKETPQLHPSPKSKTQPFEITVRLQVNLPDGQKILLRVDPTLPLYEIKEKICKQKKYADSSRYTLCLPSRPDKPLLLGLSLAECKTNELNLMYLRLDPKLSSNQIQSFDRLYRTRSESQPPRENIQEIQHEQQELIDNKQRPASVQLNPPLRPPPTHPITSHTSLHAYWNDPNFDTQSQTSSCSSTTKKRLAPKPPGYISPTLNDQQIILSEHPDHHESQESLTESTKQKRKAPVLPNTNETIVDQQIKTDTEPQKIQNQIDEQQTPTTTQLVHTSHSPDQNIPESHSTTPIYSQIQKNKESTPIESPYSTVKATPTPPPLIIQREEIINTSPTNYSVNEIVQAGIAEPPRATSPVKSSKKRSTSTEGLVKIINDHNQRAQAYQENEKQGENVSYFRVAKSRHGKFETDNQGFINNTSNIFDSTTREKSPTPIQLEVTERTTHISVTVESDRKQLITRASPVPSNQPPVVAPKPSGKTITEYRTIRRTGTDGETKTTTTVRTETIPPTSTEPVDQTSSNNNETLMESAQQPDGSENLSKQ